MYRLRWRNLLTRKTCFLHHCIQNACHENGLSINHRPLASRRFFILYQGRWLIHSWCTWLAQQRWHLLWYHAQKPCWKRIVLLIKPWQLLRVFEWTPHSRSVYGWCNGLWAPWPGINISHVYNWGANPAGIKVRLFTQVASHWNGRSKLIAWKFSLTRWPAPLQHFGKYVEEQELGWVNNSSTASGWYWRQGTVSNKRLMKGLRPRLVGWKSISWNYGYF